MKNKIEKLLEKYELKRIQSEKEYANTKARNFKHRGCCMEADVKARMDEIQQFCDDLQS